MRLSEQQVRERFEREVRESDIDGAPDRSYCDRDDAAEAFVRLAADLQAPPTGEEVDASWEALDATWDGVFKILHPSERQQIVHDTREFGAACARAGAAEAGKLYQAARDGIAEIATWRTTFSAGELLRHLDQLAANGGKDGAK